MAQHPHRGSGDMIAFIIRRTAGAVLVLIGASFLTFLLLSLAPGDAALAIAKARHGADMALDADSLARIRVQAGLDQPLLLQYGYWLQGIVMFDFGHSLISGRPVAELIAERFARTLQLAAAALGVAVLLSLPLGLMAGIFRGTAFDRLCIILASLGAAMPNFWLGTLLIFIFAVQLGWLPAFGRGDWQHLVLPALTLGTGVTLYTARLLRSSVAEVLDSAHLAATRARGIAERRVIGRHAFRNALIPVVTIFALEIGFLLEGAVAVEYVFGWHGLGLLFIEAVDGRDYPVIQAIVLLSAVVFVLLNFIVDVLYWWLDPRTRDALR